MEDQPLVSVIVSVFNSEKYLKYSIESVLNQTYNNLELVVVDDGSTDGSASIIKSYNDTRIKYFYQENKGQCAASNKGFDLSTGDLVKFFDSDDILDKNTIKSQVNALAPYDFNKICFTNLAYFSDSNPSEFKLYEETLKYNCQPIELLTYMGKPRMLNNALWLFPRDILLKRGLWKEDLSLINDTEFITRIIIPEDRLIYSKDGLLFYRVNYKSGSLSQTVSRKAIKSAIKSIDLTASYMLAAETSARVSATLAKSYQMILEWAYPYYPDLAKLIEKRLKKFPENHVIPTSSGKGFNLLTQVLGWKTTKFLQIYYYKFRYK